MNLSTDYLGLKLRGPIIVGASPFCDDTFVARRLQDAGAAAVVMRSLFAEQVVPPPRNPEVRRAAGDSAATANYPEFADYQLSVDQYLEQVSHLKANLSVPVIASLGGAAPGEWTSVARRLVDAGADAIELNVYHVGTDPDRTGDDIEIRMIETLGEIRAIVKIPVAVKLSPFHTSLPHFTKELERAGAAGIVLFNRFYQPDVNPVDMEVQPTLRLSEPEELLLRLRWLAILSPRLKCSLSAAGGIHSTNDVLKALLAGATTIQVVSVLLRHGPHVLAPLLTGLMDWMKQREYGTLGDFRGLLNHRCCPDPGAFERANYIRILQQWHV